MRIDNACIIALATPPLASALAVIRISGAGCAHYFAPAVHGAVALEKMHVRKMYYTHIIISESIHNAHIEIIDDVMLARFEAPRSFTGEDMIEIYAHGSVAGVQRILHEAQKLGIRMAEPGEFSLRSFINGKIDLSQAEAIHALIHAQNVVTHRNAIEQVNGRMSECMATLRVMLVDIMAQISVQLDYDEFEVDTFHFPVTAVQECIVVLSDLLRSYDVMRQYEQGVQIVLAGRVNAGKSSLFNELLRSNRALVSSEAGTTRDYIHEQIMIEDVCVHLYDTAGYRSESGNIEHEGQKRAIELAMHADIVLYVVDACVGMSDDDRYYIAQLKQEQACVLIWNKIDAVGAASCPEHYIGISTHTGSGMHTLMHAIKNLLPHIQLDTGQVFVQSKRQAHLLVACQEQLHHIIDTRHDIPIDVLAMEFEKAVAYIGEITGEVTSNDILDSIFSSFCLGK